MNFCPNCQIGLDNYQSKERHCNNCGHSWDVYHVRPNDDMLPHSLSTMCACCPTVKEHNGNVIVTHSSFDGREGIEQANEILNPNNKTV